MIQIKVANLKEFIDLPFQLYKGSPLYIHDLRLNTKHLLTTDPFWQNASRELFLATQDGKPVGRVAAIINRNHNAHWGDKTGFFGFFECQDSPQVAQALLNAACAWLRERGLQTMRGPLNPGTNHTCGVLLDNFDKQPFVMMPYNPPYYDGLLQGCGLAKAKDLLAFERTDKDHFSPRMDKIMARILKNPALVMRPINLKDFDREVQTVRQIYNAAWAQNWGFVPITKAEIKATAKELKMIVRPELTCIIELDGKPAGFSISVPNMNHVLAVLGGSLANPFKLIKALFAWRKIRDCRMIMLGVHPDYRGKGLELLLVRHVVYNGIKAGWNKAELSWLLEDNQGIISTVEEAGCRKTKTYRIYEKGI